MVNRAATSPASSSSQSSEKQTASKHNYIYADYDECREGSKQVPGLRYQVDQERPLCDQIVQTDTGRRGWCPGRGRERRSDLSTREEGGRRGAAWPPDAGPQCQPREGAGFGGKIKGSVFVHSFKKYMKTRH